MELIMSSPQGVPDELVVGPEKATSFAHEVILRKSSKFVDAELKAEWGEGQKRVIHFPDDNADAVYAYLQWLSWYRLQVKAVGKQRKSAFPLLTRLYLLGEKMLDDAFQDCVLSANAAHSTDTGHMPGAKSVTKIHDGTAPSSPVRRWLIDSWVNVAKSNWLSRCNEREGGLPQEFKGDLIPTFIEHRSLDDDGRRRAFETLAYGPLCAYHKHGSAVPCTVRQSCITSALSEEQTTRYFE